MNINVKQMAAASNVLAYHIRYEVSIFGRLKASSVARKVWRGLEAREKLLGLGRGKEEEDDKLF